VRGARPGRLCKWAGVRGTRGVRLRGLWLSGCARGEVEVRGLGGLGMALFGVRLGWRKTSVVQLPWAVAFDGSCKVLWTILNRCHDARFEDSTCVGRRNFVVKVPHSRSIIVISSL
jgi:hypothetical protein